MRARVHITYEYDITPEHYPEEIQKDPSKMASFDLDVDAMATFADADNWTVHAVELYPGYHDAGFGCKQCGCRPAMIECNNLCVPCYREAHPLTDEA